MRILNSSSVRAFSPGDVSAENSDTKNHDILSNAHTTGRSILEMITKRGETSAEKVMGRITAKVFGIASAKISNTGVVTATANH
jgi:hypothetical protein